jgi:acetyl-CoA carboxylase beta subunit
MPLLRRGDPNLALSEKPRLSGASIFLDERRQRIASLVDEQSFRKRWPHLGGHAGIQGVATWADRLKAIRSHWLSDAVITGTAKIQGYSGLAVMDFSFAATMVRRGRILAL